MMSNLLGKMDVVEMTRSWFKSGATSNVQLRIVLLIQGVIMAATLLSTVVAAHEEPEPSPPASSPTSLCSRELAATLWGGAFAFFSLLADAWAASAVVESTTGEPSVIVRIVWVVAVLPLAGLWGALMTMFVSFRFRQILIASMNPEYLRHESRNFQKIIRYIGVLLFGTSNSSVLKSTSILVGTEVVLGKRKSLVLPDTHVQKRETLTEKSMVNALTLGHRVFENSDLVSLTEEGKEALLRTNVLPTYEQLLFLRGKGSVATAIIAIQAIGYMTAISYRAVKGLSVSPVEGIGFGFSMLVIVHSLVRFYGGLSQHVLVIYLDPVQEQEISYQCYCTRWSFDDKESCTRIAFMCLVVIVSAIVAFTIQVEWHVLKKYWLDAIGPILFVFALSLQIFSIYLEYWDRSEVGAMLGFACSGIMSLGAIVVVVVATVMHWRHNNFDTRTPSVVHNLPFLG
jgi:hypothetical protein